MFKIISLILVLVVTTVSINAQRKPLNGFLLDSITHYPIASGTITNTNTKKSVQSDDKGFFRIDAMPNDFINALAASYHHDSLSVPNLFADTITIYLSPWGNILPGVIVTTKYNKYQLDGIERKNEFTQNRGTKEKVLSSSHPSGFGLTISLDRLLKQKYKYTRRDELMFENREKAAYINYRFSPYFVALYTRYKGEELRKFIQLYTPSYEWLRKHPDNEDVMLYINDKLKEYKSKLKH